jgi:cysteine desulfurase / selenocysteine lyase
MELLVNSRIQPAGTTHERRALLEGLRSQFTGLHTVYPLADGRRARRIYLDSAASNLRLEVSDEIVRRAMAHYANTHSQLHFGARVMTELYDGAHEIVLEFVNADQRYTAIFCGNGVTGALNRMARVLREQRPNRDTVITTIMEHHANDLPHRKHVGRVVHVPVEKDPDGEAGRVDMAALRAAVAANRSRLNYVAITAASNVTGVVNPVHEIARIAHEAGALLVVDAAQSAAHLPISVAASDPLEEIDVLCLSGHKIYTPGSPGVIVARRALFEGLEPQEVGGGVVSFVDTKRYQITPDLPDREETGTPNLPGALALAATLYALARVGMDVIEEDERALTQYALDRFSHIPGLHLYGSHRLDVAARIGVLTFNLKDLPHGLVTAALNDYFGIAVRNECFCAQPFVRQLLGLSDEAGVAPDACVDACQPVLDRPGMVRVSLGLYNTRSDIDAAAEALQHIAEEAQTFRQAYESTADGTGDWRHRTFRFDPKSVFSIEREVDAALDRIRDPLSC